MTDIPFGKNVTEPMNAAIMNNATAQQTHKFCQFSVTVGFEERPSVAAARTKQTAMAIDAPKRRLRA